MEKRRNLESEFLEGEEGVLEGDGERRKEKHIRESSSRDHSPLHPSPVIVVQSRVLCPIVTQSKPCKKNRSS
jgi:hypothetical protein